MKSILISIQPKWCELIASGKKRVEVRKTAPKLDPPFKCYIYCTKDKKGWFHFGKKKRLDGAVIGEFICDKIFDICIEISKPDDLPGYPFPCTGLTDKEILQYLGNGKTGYGWHISNLVIYDEPRPLSAFRRPCVNDLYCEECGMHSENTGNCGNAALQITRPPQSWCYVEGL